jgi:hypothetical protein
MLRTGLWAISAVAAVCLLPSCSGRQLTETDVVGTWVPDTESQKRLASVDRAKCQIVFSADGSLTAEAPSGLMQGDGSTFDLVTRSGDWSVTQDLYGETEVELHFRAEGGRIESYDHLRSQVRGDRFELYFFIGDPDSNERFVFERTRPLPKE